MTDDIEELMNMQDSINKKIRYYKMEGDKERIAALIKNLNKISEKIEEIKKIL